MDKPRPLPAGVKTITEHFRAAGYYTVNLSPNPNPPRGGEEATGGLGSGKTDFNFIVGNPYDGNDWSAHGEGQPFFAHVNILAPHRGSPWRLAQQRAAPHLDPAAVRVPPYAKRATAGRVASAVAWRSPGRWGAAGGVLGNSIVAENPSRRDGGFRCAECTFPPDGVERFEHD